MHPKDQARLYKQQHQYQPTSNLKRQKSRQPVGGDSERGLVKRVPERRHHSAHEHQFGYEPGVP